MFARNCFDKLDSPELNVEIKLDKKVSVREAANIVNVAGGQGVLKCNCTTECITKRCNCKKGNVLCNSRCHGSNNKCKNK